MLAFACVATAQTSDADAASALLQQGIKEYQAYNFSQSKAVLLKVDQGSLNQADRITLAEYLNRVDGAIRRQSAAQEALEAGVSALENNNLEDARRNFALAADSEFLPPSQRQAAQQQLVLTEQRIAAAPAAAPAQTDAQPVVVQAQDQADAEVAQAEPAETAAPAETATPVTPAPVIEDPMAQVERDRAQARELLEQARLEMQLEQYQTALTRLRQAQALAPNLPEIEQALSEAEARVAQREQAGDHLSKLARRIQRYKQAADISIEESLRRAREIVSAAQTGAEFDAAAGAINVAENTLASNRQYYSAEEIRQRDMRIGEVDRLVTRSRADWERAQADAARAAIAQQEAQRIAGQQAAFQQELDRLSDQAQVLVRGRQYDEAISVLEEIVRLEPNNRWAREQITLLEQISILEKDRSANHDRTLQTQMSLVDLRESEIPWYDLIRYPRDWRDITARRQPLSDGLGSENEASRALNNRLKTMRIPRVQFDNVGLEAVIDWIQNFANINIHVKWPALELSSPPITPDSQVRGINLTNVTVEKALRTILEDVSGGWTPLTYLVEDGVLTISTREDLSAMRYRRTEVYDIRDLIIAVPDFAGPRMEVGNAGSSNGGGGSLFNEDDDDDDNNDDAPSRQEIITSIIDLITGTIDPTSWRGDMGGDIGSIRQIHGQLVITQTPDNHREILELINKLREAQAIQIAIETRFVSVLTGFLNQIGLDLQMYFNTGSRLGGGGVTVDPATGAFVPVNGPSGWTWGGHKASGTNSLTPIPVLQRTFDDFSNVVGVETRGTTSQKIGQLVTEPGLVVAGTFLDDIQVDFLLAATQASQTSRAMTAPRLTLFNGQRAYVTVGTRTAYVSDISPVVSGNVISFEPEVEDILTGAIMDVRGTVSADRRYVTLEVRPQLSELIGFRPYATQSQIEADGSRTDIGILLLPTISVQELMTVVSVPDGGTLLLGGQKTSGEIEREKGVPLLSKVPIINRAFTNRGTVRDEETILIMIKPRIIIHREEEDRFFPPG